MVHNTEMAAQLPPGLHVTNPSPPSPESPSQAFIIATTRPKLPRVRFLLPEEIPQPDQTVKICLLHSQCYLSLGTPNLALQQGDAALHIASKHSLYALEAMSQFYRAKCFMEMKRWKEAKWALVRAATLRDFEGEIRRMGKDCEAAIESEIRQIAMEKRYREIATQEKAEFEKGR
jgi:hypothetical protein